RPPSGTGEALDYRPHSFLVTHCLSNDRGIADDHAFGSVRQWHIAGKTVPIGAESVRFEVRDGSALEVAANRADRAGRLVPTGYERTKRQLKRQRGRQDTERAGRPGRRWMAQQRRRYGDFARNRTLKDARSTLSEHFDYSPPVCNQLSGSGKPA